MNSRVLSQLLSSPAHRSPKVGGEEGTIELTAPFNAGTFDQAELILETSGAARTVVISYTKARPPKTYQLIIQ